jgi:NTE family protein
MNVQVRPRVEAAQRHLPFECIALVLQGGGALGAYQAGVYEALAEAGIHPNWIAEISIEAINAAIIAGNSRNCALNLSQQLVRWRKTHVRKREFLLWTTSTAPMSQLGHLRPS